jgi:hypothetical protein
MAMALTVASAVSRHSWAQAEVVVEAEAGLREQVVAVLLAAREEIIPQARDQVPAG